MNVKAMKTDVVLAGKKSIYDLLDDFLPVLKERSIIVITSKIIALCEGRVVSVEGTNKEDLVKKQSDYFLPSSISKYHHHFTITRNTLAAVSGIDESNSGGNYYVLWPADAQKSANEIRIYLAKKFNLQELGVIVSDSTCMPMRWGTIGIPLSYSGFEATKNYIDSPDLFGKPFEVSRAGIALGLTAAAVVAMGEGAEQTPLAVISEADFVKFQPRNPTQDELENFYIANYKDDLFEPFLSAVNWQKGGRGQS